MELHQNKIHPLKYTAPEETIPDRFKHSFDSEKNIYKVEDSAPQLQYHYIEEQGMPPHLAFTSDIEIGNADAVDFEPHLKYSKWDNEAHVSIYLPRGNNASHSNQVINGIDTIVYEDDDIKVKFYPLSEPSRDNILQTLDEPEESVYEFDYELASRPLNDYVDFNISHNNVKFVRNETQTREGFDQGFWTPNNVENSYSVFHSSKRDNHYGTGMLGVIYRPKIIDANGDYIWGDLELRDGTGINEVSPTTIRVTVDPTFLNNAIYPVIVDPTLGRTSSSGSNFQAPSIDTSYRGNGGVMPSSGQQIDSTHFYYYKSFGTGDFYANDPGLYEDTGSGTAIYQSGTGSSGPSTLSSSAWHTSTGLSFATTSGWKYFAVGVVAHDCQGSTNIGAKYSGTSSYNLNYNHGACQPTSYTWPNMSTNVGDAFSAYVTYSTAPTPTPSSTPVPTPTPTPTPVSFAIFDKVNAVDTFQEMNAKSYTVIEDINGLLNPVTSGLTIELDAANPASWTGSGSTWFDLQNNYNFTLVSSPTHSTDAGGYVIFNGTGQKAYNTTNAFYQSNSTMIFASRYAPGASIKGRVIGNFNSGTNYLAGHHSGYCDRLYAGGWVSAAANNTDEESWRIFTIVQNYSSDNWQIWANNSQIASNSSGVYGPNGIQMSGYANTLEYSNCHVAFFLVYNRVLSTTEMTQVFDHYRNRFGL